MTKLPSKRSKKRIVNEGVRRLLDTPDWNPQNFLAGREAERGRGEIAGSAKQERVFGEAEACAACDEARKDSGDTSALCERHLAEAMGFGGE